MVPEAWVDDTVCGAPDEAQAFADGDDPPGYPPGARYRNCWWVRDPGLPFYYASGINGQNVFIHVPSQTVVVNLSTWPTGLSPGWLLATVDGVLAITEELQRPE